MNTPAQLKASHSRSQRIPLWRFRLPPASSPSGYPPDRALLGARDCESSEIYAESTRFPGRNARLGRLSCTPADVGAHPSAKQIWVGRGCFLPLVPLPFQVCISSEQKTGRIERKLPMHRPTPLNTATLPISKLISRSPWRDGFPVVLFVLAVTFALSLTARAVDPPQDGGYPG